MKNARNILRKGNAYHDKYNKIVLLLTVYPTLFLFQVTATLINKFRLTGEKIVRVQANFKLI